MLNVTDLSSYLYCPRKFYLKKVLGLKEPPTKPMIEGKIRHEVREKFSNKEKQIIESFTEQIGQNQIISTFQEILNNLSEIIFEKNSPLIKEFSISKNELNKKIKTSMENEIILRSEAIKKTIDKGFFGKDLYKKLTPKYISEMRIFSEKIGLKGRADRVMISENTIIPFELKTRQQDQIYPSDEIQITSYAMLLEEKYNKPIPIGILEAGNTKHEIKITSEMKTKVTDLINEINNLLKQENPNPKFPSNFSKCQLCKWTEKCEEIEE